MSFVHRALLLSVFLPLTLAAQAEIDVLTLDPSFGGSLAVDSAAKRVYVANQFGANTVQAFDTYSLAPAGSAGSGGSLAFAVDVAPTLDRLFVAAGNNLAEFQASALLYQNGIPMGAMGVAVNRATGQVYSAESSTLWRVDGATFSVVDSTPVAGPACGFNINCVAVNDVTDRVYVVNFGDPGSVEVFDGTTLDWLAAIPARYATGIAVDTSLNRIFVAVTDGDNVLVIDGATNTPIGSINLGGTAGFLGGLAADSKRHRLYVARRVTPGSVVIVDASALTVKTTVPLSIPVAQQVAVDPLSARVFARSETTNQMSVIQDSPPCTASLDLGYAGGRLTMNMVLGTTYNPSQFRMWLVTQSGITSLVNRWIGVVDPPRPISPSFPLPAMGNVGVLMVIDTLQPEGYCWAFDSAYTGGAAAPAVDELKARLRRAGVAPRAL